jgi:alpha-tubulin suppressor-like RCC1 family protein
LNDKFIKECEAGDASSACNTTDFLVYMWGSGLNGRLGNGTKDNLMLPEKSEELKKK